jgi:hypothetical protein
MKDERIRRHAEKAAVADSRARCFYLTRQDLPEPEMPRRFITNVDAIATASGAGRCRCRDCKTAYAVYRAARRAAGKDNPRKPRHHDSDGPLPRDWFRRQIWHPAVEAAGIGMNDLRHAHASWLLAGDADLQVGQGTTQPRQHHHDREVPPQTLPDADETALDALAKIRRVS